MKKQDRMKEEFKKYFKLCEDEQRCPRLLEFCKILGMSRLRLAQLCENDKILSTLFEKLCITEEEYIINSAETGEMSSSIAMLRLKQAPFCYKDKFCENESGKELAEQAKNVFEVNIHIVE